MTIALIASAAIGCGSNADLTKECEARKPTIAAGFSGCIDSVDDVGDDDHPKALAKFEVDVWTMAPSSDANDGAQATYSAHSDDDG
ncbi:MAG TPA: hypothetical protein VHZ95_07865, partial [Polyangiales bacterium]|nr:hypothetical protein [Polyangiales bacterium]